MMTKFGDAEFSRALDREHQRRGDAAAAVAQRSSRAREIAARQQIQSSEESRKAQRILDIGKGLAELAVGRRIIPDMTVQRLVPTSGPRKLLLGQDYKVAETWRAWRLNSFSYSWEAGIRTGVTSWNYGLTEEGTIVQHNDSAQLRRLCDSPDSLIASINDIHYEALPAGPGRIQGVLGAFESSLARFAIDRQLV